MCLFLLLYEYTSLKNTCSLGVRCMFNIFGLNVCGQWAQDVCGHIKMILYFAEVILIYSGEFKSFWTLIFLKKFE